MTRAIARICITNTRKLGEQKGYGVANSSVFSKLIFWNGEKLLQKTWDKAINIAVNHLFSVGYMSQGKLGQGWDKGGTTDAAGHEKFF